MQPTATPSHSQFEIRPAAERGTTKLAWLNGRHSFSFGRYHDPRRMGFHSLRVLNDDVIAPGGGFGEHGHDNMEIITWMIDGALTHQDSTGTPGVIRPGDVQVMSAGRGIRHSEMNASEHESAHLLQIWIEPALRDLDPAYQQRAISPDVRRNQWATLASGSEHDEALRIHQDAKLNVADLDADVDIAFTLSETRHGYLHVVSGNVTVGAIKLRSGDALTCKGPTTFPIRATEPSQVLKFDLA